MIAEARGWRHRTPSSFISLCWYARSEVTVKVSGWHEIDRSSKQAHLSSPQPKIISTALRGLDAHQRASGQRMNSRKTGELFQIRH